MEDFKNVVESSAKNLYNNYERVHREEWIDWRSFIKQIVLPGGVRHISGYQLFELRANDPMHVYCKCRPIDEEWNKVPLVYHAVGRRAFTDPLQCGIKDVEWFRVQNVVDDDGAGPRQLYGIRDETRLKEILRKVLTLFCPAEVRSSFWLPYLRSVTPSSLQLWFDEYEGGVV